jgi:hypothetical protein
MNFKTRQNPYCAGPDTEGGKGRDLANLWERKTITVLLLAVPSLGFEAGRLASYHAANHADEPRAK